MVAPSFGFRNSNERQAMSTRRERSPVSGLGGIHFGTVTPPNVGQRPTPNPESSFLWESIPLKVAQSSSEPIMLLSIENRW
jgi:hypothetical protein